MMAAIDFSNLVQSYFMYSAHASIRATVPHKKDFLSLQKHRGTHPIPQYR